MATASNPEKRSCLVFIGLFRPVEKTGNEATIPGVPSRVSVADFDPPTATTPVGNRQSIKKGTQ